MMESYIFALYVILSNTCMYLVALHTYPIVKLDVKDRRMTDTNELKTPYNIHSSRTGKRVLFFSLPPSLQYVEQYHSCFHTGLRGAK